MSLSGHRVASYGVLFTVSLDLFQFGFALHTQNKVFAFPCFLSMPLPFYDSFHFLYAYILQSFDSARIVERDRVSKSAKQSNNFVKVIASI
jgi:hypothetical protein